MKLCGSISSPRRRAGMVRSARPTNHCVTPVAIHDNGDSGSHAIMRCAAAWPSAFCPARCRSSPASAGRPSRSAPSGAPGSGDARTRASGRARIQCDRAASARRAPRGARASRLRASRSASSSGARSRLTPARTCSTFVQVSSASSGGVSPSIRIASRISATAGSTAYRRISWRARRYNSKGADRRWPFAQTALLVGRERDVERLDDFP